MTYSITGIIGSLSSHSINRSLYDAIVPLASEKGLVLTEAPIGTLPLFSQDLEADYPEAATALKKAIESADGLIIVTPEYNRSIPGVLKNAIDWASRPWGKNSFAGKPTAIIGASGGALRTSLAQRHLREILSFLDAPTLNQPEAYVHMTDSLIGPGGTVADEGTKQFLLTWLDAFRALIDKLG